MILTNIILILILGVCHVEFDKDIIIECKLSSKEETYNKGELPEFNVELINKGKEKIYLLGSLDGSDRKLRYPYCYFEIEKPLKDSISQFQGCGTLNLLREKDFQEVLPGESFDPYKEIDSQGYFPSNEIENKEHFKNKGKYLITFYYSTKSKNLQEYDGFLDYKYSREEKIVKKKLKSLLRQVPKINLKSNTIELEII